MSKLEKIIDKLLKYPKILIPIPLEDPDRFAIDQLLENPDWKVRCLAFSSNRNPSKKQIMVGLKDKEKSVVYDALRHKNATEEHFLHYIDNSSHEFEEYIIDHRNVSPKVLEILSKTSPRIYVRIMATKKINATV